MATRNYVEDLEYLDAKGLDTAAPINLMQQGFVREAVNVNLGTTGGYIKRDGYTQQTLVWPTGYTTYVIRAGLQYRNTNSNLLQPTQILLFGRNDQNGVFGFIDEFPSVSGYNPDQDPEFSPFKRYRSLGGGSFTPEVLDLNQTNRPSFAQIGNALFYFDGSGEAETPFVYEANTDQYIRPLGIAAPTAIPVGTPQAGGTLEVGQYLYSYTYVFIDAEGSEIAESSPAGLSATVETDNANKSVSVSMDAFPDYTLRTQNDLQHLTVKIKLYRTVVNGSILFLVDLPISAQPDGLGKVVYVDSIPDAGLLAEQISFDNTRLSSYQEYDEARFPVVARNRLLVFHPRQNKGRFSKIGPNGPLPESFPVQNEFSVEGRYGSSDAVVGAGQIRGIPIVLKERSIGRLEEVGLPDLGNNEDNVVFIYREISETTGGISNFAQTQVFDELIFLGRDNIYATNGEQVRPIATQLQNVIKRIDFSGSKPSNFSAINDTKNRRIYIQVYKQVGSTNLDLTLVGDYQQYPNFRWTTYEGKPGDAVTPGIVASAFFQTEATLGAGGGLEVYFADAAEAGKYYRMNSGQSDNGKDIALKLVTRPYMFGQPMLKKLYKTAKIWAEAQDTSYQFQFGAIFNLDNNEVISTPFTVPGGGTKWDFSGDLTTIWPYNASEVAAYNAFKAAKLAEDPSDTRFTTPVAPGANTVDLTWSGNLLNEYKYSVHRKAETMQLVFTQNSKNAPLTLLGWGVSGSIFSGI